MIECDLLPLGNTEETTKKKRYGRYHGSCFWDVKNFGSKTWVVGAYIDVSDPEILEDCQVEDLTRRCIEYLNQPPPRKKYAKKTPKPKYCKLGYYSSRIVEKGNNKYISALLLVDCRKSKSFWGKGRNA